MYKTKYFQLAMAATVTTAAVVALAPTADASFSDVKPHTEAAKAIDKLVEQKIIGGYPDGTFRPTNGVTRGEFAKIITLLNVDEEDLKGGKTTFKDVPRKHWAQKYIDYTVKEGLLSGDKSGKFGVEDPLTRGQFAKIMVTQLDAKVPNIKLPFTDVQKGDWYEDGVKVLLERDITTGTSRTEFSPYTPITREQLAIFLDRAGLLGEDEIDEIGPIPELEPFLDHSRVHGRNAFEQLKAIVKEKGTIIATTTVPNVMPKINLETNQIDNIQKGQFSYRVNPKDNNGAPGYVLLVTYNTTGVESFKLYTQDQFEQKVKTLKGPEQLEKAIKSTYGYNEEVRMDLFYIGYVQLNERNDVYYDFLQGKPVLATNADQAYFENMRYAYLLTPQRKGDIYDFTVKEVKPFTINVPSNAINYRIVVIPSNENHYFDQMTVLLNKPHANGRSIDIYPYTVSYNAHNELPVNSLVQVQYIIDNTGRVYSMDYIYQGNNRFVLR